MIKTLLAQLLPLRWPLYAYALSGGDASAAAALLEIKNPPDSAGAWETYAAVAPDEEAGPLHNVREKLHLDSFLIFAVKLALAAELLPAYRAVLDMMGGLTQELAILLFSASPEEAVSLKILWRRRKKTVHLLFGEPNGGAPLRLRPVVLDYLLGEIQLPEFCEILAPKSSAPLVHCEIPRQIARQLSIKPSGNIFCLSGEKGSGRKYWLARYIEEYGGSCVRLRDISREMFADIKVYIALTDTFLLMEDFTPEKLSALIRAVCPENLFIACEEDNLPATQEGYSLIRLQTPILSYEDRLTVWKSCLTETPEIIASQYRFTIGQILNASRMAKESAARESAEPAAALHTACQSQLANSMNQMAQKVRTEYTWDDLILPPPQMELLRHIRDRVLYGETVRGAWGVDSAVGNGVRALFSGPPGTGKTMAAQIISRELKMEMYTVNLSALVSKYIGETEKNLESVFTEAAKSGGVLFFDEADALFGRRGEQKDSHDKYANMQTAFLLQRFESYEGVTLLATNLTSNLDPAFLRRIQVRVEFPAPDAETRQRLWESFLKSPRAPLSEDIDIPFLAETFEITGSAIRNITLTAAFIAAAETGVIGMKELLRAVGVEYAKLDKVLTPRELGEWGE